MGSHENRTHFYWFLSRARPYGTKFRRNRRQESIHDDLGLGQRFDRCHQKEISKSSSVTNEDVVVTRLAKSLRKEIKILNKNQGGEQGLRGTSPPPTDLTSCTATTRVFPTASVARYNVSAGVQLENHWSAPGQEDGWKVASHRLGQYPRQPAVGRVKVWATAWWASLSSAWLWPARLPRAARQRQPFSWVLHKIHAPRVHQ
jgi:hypothetical protein